MRKLVFVLMIMFAVSIVAAHADATSEGRTLAQESQQKLDAFRSQYDSLNRDDTENVDLARVTTMRYRLGQHELTINRELQELERMTSEGRHISADKFTRVNRLIREYETLKKQLDAWLEKR